MSNEFSVGDVVELKCTSVRGDSFLNGHRGVVVRIFDSLIIEVLFRDPPEEIKSKSDYNAADGSYNCYASDLIMLDSAWVSLCERVDAIRLEV